MNLKRFRKFLAWGAYNTIFVLLALEFLLRMAPGLMPFAHTWNYIHHYLEISRFLQEPTRLALNNYPTVAIGDSFTRGAEVSPNSDWPALLNSVYGQKVFNLGIGGASTVEELTIMQSITFPSSVKTVLLGIFNNDIEANIADLQRLNERGPQPFLDRSNRASDVGHYESCKASWLQWIQEWKCVYLYSYAISAMTDIYRQFALGDAYQQRIHDLSPYIYDSASQWYLPKTLDLAEYESFDAYVKLHDEGVATTMALVSVMKDLLAERKIKLIVVYFPAAKELYATEFGRLLGKPIAHSSSVGSLLKPYMADLHIPFLDLSTELSKVRLSDAPLYRRFDEHFTEAGHKASARIIAPFLIKHTNP